MKPSSNAEDPTNPAGREIKDRRGGGESPDHRESSGGRRSSNWVGYYPLSFRQLLHIHSDSVRLVGTAILIGLILSLGVWIVTPYVYHATGTILIDELPFIQMQKTADAETERQLVQTLILSIANRDMRVEVEKQLGLPPGRIAFNGLDRRLPLSGPEPKANVQISPVRNSRLGSISADSQSPEFAARVVNAILSDLDLYNRIGGRLKELQTTAALSKTQADNSMLQLADVSAQRIKLEQESEQLENYLKQGLPLADYPVFAQDATLSNLKTQLFLVESEYKSIAATSTRGQKLEGKASELASLRRQLNLYAKRLADSLHSEYTIRLSQEKGLLENKQKAAEKLDTYSQESTGIAQSFGNPEKMRGLLSDILVPGQQGNANMIVVVNAASVPKRPYSPLLILYLMVGGLLGGLVGLGIAGLTTIPNSSLVSAAQIETQLGLPCLAVIPSMGGGENATDFSTYAGLEDFPSLDRLHPFDLGDILHLLPSAGRTNEFSIEGFAPALAGQRNPELVARVGSLLAKAGHRVVIVDLHFSNPKIAKTLGMTITKGLEEWVDQRGALSWAINPVSLPYSGKLAVISSSTPNTDLAVAISHLPLSTLSSEWDLVLIDAPCILNSKKLLMALPHYSNLIITADYRATKMSAIKRVCAVGRSHQWRVAGVVITNAPADAHI